jgi:pimeloyl-ACP methyl ester carboxylesterase
MPRPNDDRDRDLPKGPEGTALRAIASIIGRRPGHLCLSDVQLEVLLAQHGLSPEQSDHVRSLLDRVGPREWLDVGPGVLDPPELCPISWRPTVLTPVFWGRHLLEADGCLPANTRVYYPSLDGAVQNAPLLEHCGQFPLILFLHGHCQSEDDHVYRWERTLAQLARSGFVVAAPSLSLGSGPQQDSVFAQARGVLRWMRRHWAGRHALLPAPATGVFGHSYGAMVAARVATTPGVSAFAGLSAGWHEWATYGPLEIPLFKLAVPSLHMWGTEGLFSDAISDEDLAAIAMPRHHVVLEGGEHWVYLQGQTGGCAPAAGGCHLLGAVAGDLVAGFFARYLPPLESEIAGGGIPPSLVPPEIELTFEQEFYAGGHLGGLAGLAYADGCRITSAYAGSFGTSETVLQS